ncbi:MAG: hypothetical protein ACK6CU_04435 [Deltaproteobacteria bacterium]
MGPALLGALASPASVSAHGGRPQTYDVLFDPSDETRVVVPASFGFLVSEDAGATFSLLCTGASPDPRPGTPRPSVVTPSGTLLVARELGLLRGPALGCGLDYVGAELRGAFFADVVLEPGTEALALRSDAAVANAIFVVEAGGTRLAPLGTPFPPDFLPERVRTAPSDRRRVWVSGTARRPGTAFVDGRIYVSSDRGASYALHTVPLELDERRVRVLAIDPRDPDHAIGVIHARAVDRPLALRGSPRSVELRRLGPLEADPARVDRAFGAAFLPDGTAWLGNDLAGLHALEVSGAVRVIDAALGVSCVVVHGEHVYVCADDLPDALGDGFAVARQRLGAPYAPEPFLRFIDIAGPRSCGLPSDEVCATTWPETLADLGRVGGADAGLDPDAGLAPQDGGGPDDAGPPASPDTGTAGRDAGAAAPARATGCSVAVSAEPTAGVWLLALALVLRFARQGRGR